MGKFHNLRIFPWNPVNATFGHIYHVNAKQANHIDPEVKPMVKPMLDLQVSSEIGGLELNGGKTDFLFPEKKPVDDGSTEYLNKLKEYNLRDKGAYSEYLNAIERIGNGDYTFIKVGRLKQLLGDTINKILKPNQLKDDNDALIFVDIPHTTQGTHLGHTPFKDVKMTDDDAVKIAAEQTIAEWTETLKQPIQTILD